VPSLKYYQLQIGTRKLQFPILKQYSITQPEIVPKISCDVSFANGELHQACGHVMLSTRPKVRHNRSCSERNHVINWSGAKILEREGHRKTRQVKESIWIWKEPNCMNRDGGAYSTPLHLCSCSWVLSRSKSTP